MISNRPNAQEMELEDLIYIPNNQQPLFRPAVPDRHGREEENETTKPEGALEVPTSLDTGLQPSKPSPLIPAAHDDLNKSEEGRRREAKEIIQEEEDLTSHQNQDVKGEEYQPTPNQESPVNQPRLRELHTTHSIEFPQ